jgi:hypothetical protein
MKISCLTKWLCLVALFGGQASGASVFEFTLFSGDIHYNFFDASFGSNDLLSFTLGASGHDGEFLTHLDKLIPIILQLDADNTHLQGAIAVEYDGAVSPDLGIGVYNFSDVIITQVTSAQRFPAELDLVDFAYASSTFTPGPAPVDLINFQGGPSSNPILLPNDSIVSGITGTIGGFGSQNYYDFLWNGGTFNATGSITGADALASYSFSSGSGGGCNSLDLQRSIVATVLLPRLQLTIWHPVNIASV